MHSASKSGSVVATFEMIGRFGILPQGWMSKDGDELTIPFIAGVVLLAEKVRKATGSKYGCRYWRFVLRMEQKDIGGQ